MQNVCIEFAAMGITVFMIERDRLGTFHTRCVEFLRVLGLLSSANTRSCLNSGRDCRLCGSGHSSAPG